MEDLDTLEVAQATIPSPEPAPTFAGVSVPLNAALARRGYTELTSVQEAVLAADAAGRDLQISSQTGSGKTVGLGFVLAPALTAEPTLEGGKGPRAMILVPTRELAMQVREELAWLFADVAGLRLECVMGGTPAWQERARLGKGPRVVVGTPGRVLDHVKSGALQLGGVAEFVLDEADQMLDMGFREDLEAILNAAGGAHRTHLVSATFPPGIQGLAERYQKDPLRIEGTGAGEANTDIEHIGHLVNRDSRYGALVNVLLMAAGERALVFVNTRADTQRIAEQLTADGVPALPLSGELAQAERTRTLAALRSGAATVLVATDVASRGLDVPEVGLVVHAEPAMDAEVYVHRSGRTGRAGRKGKSVALVPASRERRMRQILREFGIEAAWRPVPSADEVRELLHAQVRAELSERVDSAPAPDAERLELARHLLSERDPALVVAALLESAAPSIHAKPHDVFHIRSGVRNGERRMEQTRGLLHAVAAQHVSYDDRRPARPQRGSGGSGEFERFTINWGTLGGANPKRILAHVCRRGGVTSQAVGAIRMHPHSSTFDIRRHAAGDFELRARQRDLRDPKLVVQRLTGVGA